MGNNKKKNRGARGVAAGTPAKSSPDPADTPAEFEGLGEVPALESLDSAVLKEHYNERRACVLPGAAADWKSVATWNFAVLQSLVLSNCPRGEPVDLVTYDEKAGYKINRVADLMEYMELLRQRCVSVKGASKNCPHLKRYGIDMPRKAIAEACPIPQVIQELHNSKALKLRDLMGRYSCKLATAGRSAFGLCHHNPLGHAVFYVQVKGSSTWLLYPPEEMPIRREEPLWEAVPGDFNSARVRTLYSSGRVARLKEGDVLFVPPYTCTAVRYEDAWNVTLDMVCLPDEVWAEVARCPLAMADSAQLLGGRALLCYTLPGALPAPRIVQQVREGLLGATFDADAALVSRCMVARDGGVEGALRAAALCACGATMAECLLDCAIASKAAFRSSRECLKGLAILGYQQHARGAGAMKELGVNVAALQAAAWATLGRQPPAPGLRPSPGEAEGEVEAVVADVAGLWGKAGGKRGEEARAQVAEVMASMATALDDLAFLVPGGVEGGAGAAATPEAAQTPAPTEIYADRSPAPAPNGDRRTAEVRAEERAVLSPRKTVQSPIEESPPVLTGGRKAEAPESSPTHAAPPTTAVDKSPAAESDADGAPLLPSTLTLALAAGLAATAGLYYFKYYSSRA